MQVSEEPKPMISWTIKISLFTILWITYQNVLNANELQKYSPKLAVSSNLKIFLNSLKENNDISL